MNNHYEIIFITESGFQEKVVNYLIKEKFKEKKYLLIKNREGVFISSENTIFNINFNHLKGFFRSIFGFFNFPSLSCDILVGTQFTGSNCRFFEAVIDYKELHLIDDGIGTPVILKKPNLYLSLKSELIKFYLLEKLLLLRSKKIKSTEEIIFKISVYYSIYKYSYKNLEVIPIKIFQSNYKSKQENKIGFVGQPLVDYKIVKPEYYKNTLQEISKKNRAKIYYYPDPSEKWIYTQKLNCIEIVNKNEPLESYFLKNNCPKIMVSYISSALLNLKIIFPLLNCYYVKIIDKKNFRDIYYEIFEDYNINNINDL